MASTGNKGKRDPRKERLKAALRENLRRRKVQERARGAAPAPAGPDSEAETAEPDKSR